MQVRIAGYRTLTLALGAALVLTSGSGLAGKPQDPEDCILKTLSGSHSAQSNAAMVRYNCIRRYVRLSEERAKSVPLNQLSDVSASFRPEIPALPSPLQPHLTITLKNNSPFRIISALIFLGDRNNKESSGKYYLVADYPIDPLTAGTLSADLAVTGDSSRDAATFWNSHNWQLLQVRGVSP